MLRCTQYCIIIIKQLAVDTGTHVRTTEARANNYDFTHQDNHTKNDAGCAFSRFKSRNPILRKADIKII